MKDRGIAVLAFADAFAEVIRGTVAEVLDERLAGVYKRFDAVETRLDVVEKDVAEVKTEVTGLRDDLAATF